MLEKIIFFVNVLKKLQGQHKNSALLIGGRGLSTNMKFVIFWEEPSHFNNQFSRRRLWHILKWYR